MHIKDLIDVSVNHPISLSKSVYVGKFPVFDYKSVNGSLVLIVDRERTIPKREHILLEELTGYCLDEIKQENLLEKSIVVEEIEARELNGIDMTASKIIILF